VGREANYRNPYGSNPGPTAKEIPITFWYTQAGMPVAWAGLDALGDDNAFWQTPVFDLRPDLRSSQNMAKSGVPIWDTAARLYVQIFGLTTAAINTEFLRLEYREHANTTFGQVTSPGPNRATIGGAPPPSGVPNQIGRDPVIPVTPFIDITSEMMLGTNQPDSVVLVFEMLGEGYPIRYWQCEIHFVNVGGAGPDLNFQAAMY
jgi:hypothetical protein